MIGQAVLGSAAIVLMWSSETAQTAWVERQVLFAVYKPMFPVVLDGTSVPNTLVRVWPVNGLDAQGGQRPVTEVVAALMALPVFPPAQSNDPLISLCERAAHEYIRERKAAIEQAAEMLKRGEQREAVLAVLSYLARHDLMIGVREKAQEVLDAGQSEAVPSASSDSRHLFGVRCKNGHVSYFDKRVVCTDYQVVPRILTTSADKELDTLMLHCKTCGVEVTTRVDCGAYK